MLHEGLLILSEGLVACRRYLGTADYEALLKSHHKSQQVIEQEGVPNFFVRALASLEAFVEEKHRDKEWFKKLSKPKALAVNTLRAKVRKTAERWMEQIEDCRQHPEKYESQNEASDDFEVGLAERATSRHALRMH